ncbi:hypothetical protein [Shewanella gelidii]|uniref:Uncharacterized protein n=1 Tax=Shewanella gelidii TaxID=1642821 RepID=A0A917NDZ4_9GAMM|nr:hypothetical protein [Shewanella gelidii]MCL1098078.1 hypothetical protein [Shewanella gelidii]MCL1098085.1 hypothetical protein [Shewanella gelidii]GGI93598.1 hypothetical protein GCM10009332_33540 [Shewanella gelidii]
MQDSILNSLSKLRPVAYKGGISFVDRDDDPDYQCKQCYKPWWKDELDKHVFIVCQKCHGELRAVTEQEPLET